MGPPVVASDLRTLRAVVHQGESGVLVDPSSPVELVGALEYRVGDEEAR